MKNNRKKYFTNDAEIVFLLTSTSSGEERTTNGTDPIQKRQIAPYFLIQSTAIIFTKPIVRIGSNNNFKIQTHKIFELSNSL